MLPKKIADGLGANASGVFAVFNYLGELYKFGCAEKTYEGKIIFAKNPVKKFSFHSDLHQAKVMAKFIARICTYFSTENIRIRAKKINSN